MRALIIIAGGLAWATAAAADPATGAKATYDASVKQYIAVERGRVDAAFAAATDAVLSDRAGARAQALEPNATTALTNLATTAIKTDLEDVEAGVQIAPLVLAGRRSPAARAWSVTIASLEESRVRVGTAYRFAFDDLGAGPEEVMKACKPDFDALEKAFAARAQDFVDVCTVALAFDVPSDADARDVWLETAAACGAPLPDGLSTGERESFDHVRDADVFAKLTTLAIFMSDLAPLAAGDLAPRVAGIGAAAARLDALRTKQVGRGSCFDDDDLAAAVAKAKWKKRDRALGIGLATDWFPIVRGFDVDPATDDSAGELAKASLNGEYRWSGPRTTFSIGLGGAGSREAAGDDLAWSVTGSASFDYVVARLDGRPLTDADGNIALEDGAPPPMFSLGVAVSTTVPVDPSDKQEELFGLHAVDELTLSAFADLRFTKDLAVRLGVPLKGKAETRESDEKRGLVWTVPVSLTTVLKL